MKPWAQFMIVSVVAGHFLLQLLYFQCDFQPPVRDDLRRVDGGPVLTYKRKLNNAAPSVLPDRLITVFGLESSGTTFLATTLARALGKNISSDADYDDQVHDRWRCNSNKTEIQHVSEPFGYFVNHFEKSKLPTTMDVFLPNFCMMHPHEGQDTTEALLFERMDRKPNCNSLLNIDSAPILYPQRFFVNITSHIDWYRSRGVDATAVIVVRDASIHFRGVAQYHLANKTAAREQYEVGRQLLAEALGHEHVIFVSYEAMMCLQDAYLLKLYKDLGIDSIYVPDFRDGNDKHLLNVTSYLESKKKKVKQ